MRHSRAKKTIITFLTIAMLMPGVYLAFRPAAPVQAQLPNLELFSLGNIAQWVWEAVFTGIETAVYKTLKNLAKSLAHKMVETALTEFATGKKGQEPFWSTKAWDKEMKDIGGKTLGFLLEGTAKGFDKGMKRTAKKDLLRRSDNLSRAAVGFRDDSDTYKRNGDTDAASRYGMAADRIENKAKNMKGEVDQMNKNDKKRAEADRRGRAGGTSEEVANALAFLCNPSANISLKISLGMGSLGEDPDVEPVCNTDELAKNWGAMYDQFKTFDASKVNYWKTLGDLFDTNSSDIGVAFNANATFLDVHEKQTATAAMEAFIQSLTGKPGEDEAGNIKTPGDLIRQQLTSNLDKGAETGTDPQKGLTGKYIADGADIIGTFVDSLASKGMDYLKDGVVRNIKAWQETSKDKEFNNLANTLDENAKLQTAQAVADAARERASEARTVADAHPEDTALQTAATTAEATATTAETNVTTLVAANPRSTQAVNNSQSAVLDAIYNPDATPSNGGIAAVRQYTASLTRVNGMDGGVMDILSQLRSTECSTSVNACVLGDAFANAVQQKMTVKEAIESFKRGESAGLNPDGVFGFNSQAPPNPLEQAPQPMFQTNFPYNSLVILRKYRVVPVSWELAALYIKDHNNACGNRQNCRLQYMVDNFDNKDSKFFRLVDPNWVLKIPSAYCALKGYGPIQGKTQDTRQTVCKSDTNGDGVVCCDKSCLSKTFGGFALKDESEKTTCLGIAAGKVQAGNDPTTEPTACGLDDEEQTAIRTETCVDEQSCLVDDAQGKCAPKMYGYCLEEKKIWRFNGTQCNAIFASCDAFTEKSTQQTSYYLKDSITISPSSECKAETAGCQWYSKTRNVGAAKKTGSLIQDWSSAVTDKVYLTPKVTECSAQAEGCRGIEARDSTGVTSTVYAKIAPDYLNCKESEKINAEVGWKPAYRREECKPFALHCSDSYTGCELYTPQEVGGFPIAARNPTAGCREACAGLTSYSIQKTRLESQLRLTQTATSAAFIPTSPTVELCPVTDVGCDEFTNVLVGAQAEQRDYFKDIHWCEKKPADPTVFYSPIGSNVGGYALEKFGVKADSDGAPACSTVAGTPESCTCTEDEYYGQFSDPTITTLNCRQLYVRRKDSGAYNPEYYKLDKLVYYTDDCKDYRRTLDGDKGSVRKISPSLSKTCPSSSARCRDFRDPTAGNVVMVDYSNFEDGTADGWSASTGGTAPFSAQASNESESLGNHSLEARGNAIVGAVTFEKNGLLLLGDVSYLAGLSIKVPGNASSIVAVDLLGFEDAQGSPVNIISIPQSLPPNTWRYLTFSFQKTLQGVRPTSQGSSGMRITVTPDTTSGIMPSSVLLDSITLKQASGVIYAIDDSWVLPDACVADPADKTTADPKQIGCKLYTNSMGAQAVFSVVERLCPNEMVGCKAYTMNSTPLYLIEDAAKSCSASDNSCTAYGLPILDISGGVHQRILDTVTGAKTEDWMTRYVKVTPAEAAVTPADTAKGVCPSTALGCKTYMLSGQQDQSFFDPGSKVCQWRDAKESDIGTKSKDEIRELKIKGIWYYKTCSGGDIRGNIACTSDKDCQDIKPDSTCAVENPCVADIPKTCPTNQKTCRKITDPECTIRVSKGEKTEKLKDDYGRGTPDVSCQREYYYLSDAKNKGECEGRVDVEGGCLLFNDANAGVPKFNSAEYYKKYFDNGIQGVSTNATTNNTNPDANNLFKVRLDRACKTWLECESYVYDAVLKKNVCLNRLPCNTRAPDGSCVNFMERSSIADSLPGGTGEQEKVLKHAFFPLPATPSSPIPFASLTGMARPDLMFPDAWSTSLVALGHDSLFGWEQASIEGTKQFKLTLTTTDTRVSSCRVRPRSDAPEIRYAPKGINGKNTLAERKFFVNSCDYENKKGDEYKGVDGYCIEPYPKFSDMYHIGVPDADSLKSILPARNDNASYGFKGACLNWYPSDRTAKKGTINSQADDITELPTDNVYFCAEFGVRVHSETLKNSAGTPVTVRIPQVDPIPAIGRTVAVCPATGACPAGTRRYEKEVLKKIVVKYYDGGVYRYAGDGIYYTGKNGNFSTYYSDEAGTTVRTAPPTDKLSLSVTNMVDYVTPVADTWVASTCNTAVWDNGSETRKRFSGEIWQCGNQTGVGNSGNTSPQAPGNSWCDHATDNGHDVEDKNKFSCGPNDNKTCSDGWDKRNNGAGWFCSTYDIVTCSPKKITTPECTTGIAAHWAGTGVSERFKSYIVHLYRGTTELTGLQGSISVPFPITCTGTNASGSGDVPYCANVTIDGTANIFNVVANSDPATREGSIASVERPYSPALPRVDLVAYYSPPSGGATRFNVHVGTTENDTLSSDESPTKGSSPKSEINAGEIKADGTIMNIPKREARPVKLAYTITAKATFKDIYCKRVVQVVVAGKSVPFYTKLMADKETWIGATAGKQLSESEAAALGRGEAIIFKSTVESANWDGSEGTLTAPQKNNYLADTPHWPTNLDLSRYGYSLYDKGAKYESNIEERVATDYYMSYYKDLETYTYDWKKDGTHPHGDWSVPETSADIIWPDREAEAITVAVGSSTSAIHGMPKEIVGVESLKSYVVGNGFEQKPYDRFASNRIIILPVTETNLDSLSDGGSKKNFDIAAFNYANPSIPFAKYYGDWTLSGTDGTTLPLSVGTGSWFPNRPPPSYPNIYDEDGVANRFSYVKTQAGPIIELRFYVDVENDHLPIRGISIDWHDTTDLTKKIDKLPEDFGDGKGSNELPPCGIASSNTTTPPCTTLNTKKFVIGHRFKDKQQSIDDSTVTIKVKDNWGEITWVKGVLQDDNFNGVPTFGHSEPAP